MHLTVVVSQSVLQSYSVHRSVTQWCLQAGYSAPLLAVCPKKIWPLIVLRNRIGIQPTIVLQCYIVVLQSGIRQATPRPSLSCARAIPEAVCPPVPFRETAYCSPADIAPVRILLWQRFGKISRNLSDMCIQPAVSHGIGPSIIGLNDLDQFIISTYTYKGFCVSLVHHFKQPASSDPGSWSQNVFWLMCLTLLCVLGVNWCAPERS